MRSLELYSIECRPIGSSYASCCTAYTYDFGEIMKPTKLLLLAFTLTLSAVLPVTGVAAGVKYKTVGTYTDSAGGQHAWSVNDAHTLLWDGDPYIPVGGAFVSRYITLGATDENYQADVSALETLKSKGITDIILKSTGAITSTDAAAWQKMIDYLDSSGFDYGIEMNDGPKDALKGYLISASVYRLDGPSDQQVITCEWPDVDSAIYVIVNKLDNAVKSTGGALVKDGKVTINLPEGLSASQNLVIYPHKSFKSAVGNGMGDIWGGFDEYRDRMLAFMKKLKFGPGLRFFLEPFTSKMDFTGEMTSFIPDSSGFRLGFEAYLTRKYTHEGSVNAAWGLNENLDSIELAARLMPLWSNGRGVAYAYDRASAHMYPVDPVVSHMWLDLMDYRDISSQQYMNTIADALKKQVANVPVVFKSSTYHRIYANPFGMSGFDGVGVAAYGAGDDPIISVAGPVYSLAEESGKTSWYLVAATQTTSGDKTSVGYSSQNAMSASLDYFREVGCKGFFVDSLQALPDDTRGNYSLLKDPQQIDWLKGFKDRVKGSSWAEFKPSVITYPIAPTTGAVVKRLAPNTWWLPSLRAGKTTFIGDGLASYTLAAEDKSYIWSLSGTRTITMKAGPSGYPTVDFPAGANIKKLKGNMFSLTLTETPTVIRGMDYSMIFPNETADLAISRLAQAIPLADAAGLGVRDARTDLDRAKSVLSNGLSMTAYGIAQTSLQQLLSGLGADIWVEGETSPATSFSGSTPMAGASGGQVLLLDTASDPPLIPYAATFYFDTQANSSYELWVAATPPSDGSSLSYSIDEINWNPVAPVDNSVTNYAPGLAWYKIGVENLFPAKHALKFRVDGKRGSDSKYYFAIDAVVLSPRGFKPDGLSKPF